jgi:hypothetical protein
MRLVTGAAGPGLGRGSFSQRSTAQTTALAISKERRERPSAFAAGEDDRTKNGLSSVPRRRLLQDDVLVVIGASLEFLCLETPETPT